MASVNRVILLGHLGRAPEIRRTQDGRAIASFSMATSESWKDKTTGERREKTEWHKVVIYNDGIAGVAEKYLRKGSKVYVEGQLQTSKWQDKDGIDRYKTEIILQGYAAKLVLLDGKDNSGGDQCTDKSGNAYADASRGNAPQWEEPLPDDRVPF